MAGPQGRPEHTHPGPDVHTPIHHNDLSPIDLSRLEHAAGGIRLRGDSVRILLKWKTARRLRQQQELRRAA